MREIVKRKDPENEITEARRELEKIEAIIDRLENIKQIRAIAWAEDEIATILKALQVHASAIRVLKLGRGGDRMNIIDLPIEVRLRQLAEECSECTKAALKLIRAMNKETPISEDEAKRNLVEEIADVSVCITALSDIALQKEICEIIAHKASRWTDRINEEQQDDGHTSARKGGTEER